MPISATVLSSLYSISGGAGNVSDAFTAVTNSLMPSAACPERTSFASTTTEAVTPLAGNCSLTLL